MEAGTCGAIAKDRCPGCCTTNAVTISSTQKLDGSATSQRRAMHATSSAQLRTCIVPGNFFEALFGLTEPGCTLPRNGVRPVVRQPTTPARYRNLANT